MEFHKINNFPFFRATQIEEAFSSRIGFSIANVRGAWIRLNSAPTRQQSNVLYVNPDLSFPIQVYSILWGQKK